MASLQFGDWVTVINPLMSDIAGSARTWWIKVVEQAEHLCEMVGGDAPGEDSATTGAGLGPRAQLPCGTAGCLCAVGRTRWDTSRYYLIEANVVDQRDGLVLMTVLNKVGEVISKGNGQVSFRIASLKML